jgi:hypothetical protein
VTAPNGPSSSGSRCSRQRRSIGWTHGAHFVEITGQSFRAEHTKKQLTARRSRGASAA